MRIPGQAPEARQRPSGPPASPRGFAWVLDTVLVVVVAVAALVLLAHGGLGLPSPRARSLDLTRIVLGAATAVPLLGWRRWPLGAFAIVGAASILLAARGEEIWPPVGLVVAVFLLVRGRPGNSPWPRWRLGVVLLVLGGYLVLGVGEVGELLHSVVALAAAWLAGEVSRLRRAQLADLRDRAARVERDAARERDLAVAEERTRIARDLHDSVAHALNVISVRAGAARLRGDPGHALATVGAIEDLSRATMADIDRVVGSLRTRRSEDRHVEAPPGLAALDALVAEHRTSGHEVSLAVTGLPGSLPPPAEHGVYRIVQEALTNASRHGSGATRVELTHDIDAIKVRVSNRVDTAGLRVAPDGGGHGLVGMRERAHALGGEITTGHAGEEFRVCARIPHDGRPR